MRMVLFLPAGNSNCRTSEWNPSIFDGLIALRRMPAESAPGTWSYVSAAEDVSQ